MTNEEAVKKILEHKTHWERLAHEHICDEKDGTETIETFEKAISALKTESCEDAISREAVLRICKMFEQDLPLLRNSIRVFKLHINALPSVQPEAKTGRWITQWDLTLQKEYYCCSECRETFSYDKETGIEMDNYTYCPNCGAKMEGEEE